jgi:hypothetical protein
MSHHIVKCRSFDQQLLSLPLPLNDKVEYVPVKLPSIYPDRELIDFWKDEFSLIDGFKIGISLRGTAKDRDDQYSFFPLDNLSKIAELEDIALISLQRGYKPEQLKELGNLSCLKRIKEMELESWSLIDTAALMLNLNLIVTSDIAIANLACLLGIPSWLILPVTTNWISVPIDDNNFWYPSMRIFRQQKPGDWKEVFERVACEVDKEYESWIKRKTICYEN